MIIRYGLTGVLCFLLILLSANITWGQTDFGKVKCICIDAGHGGKDPGASGLKVQEKNLVLSIALKLGRMVKEKYPDIKVVYTRDRDVFIDLDKRGKIANDHKADLFISIHINSSKVKSPHGLETYVLGLHRSKENLEVAMKENSVIKYEKDYSLKYAGFDPTRVESYIIFSLIQNLYLEKSLNLAAFVQEEMVEATRRTDRGVRQAGYLVLKDAAMPAILIEAGFISNPEEERYLCTQAAQTKIAASICKAIGKYKANIEKNNSILKRSDEIVQNAGSSEVNKETGTGDELFYAIQIASAKTKVKNSSQLCSGEKVGELVNGERYRYYVAGAQDLEKVKKDLQRIRTKIKDCFVIAVYKGKVIPVAEARKLEQK